MTNLWLMLVVKSTVVLGMGALAAAMLQRRSAAARHLVWLCVVLVLLLMPLGLLLPQTVIPSPRWEAAASAVTATGTAVGRRVPGSIFVTLWLAGVTVFLARLLIAVVRAARVVHRAAPGGTSAGYPVRFTADLDGPVAWSFGKGIIILPAAADRWPEDTRNTALVHETAHLVRRDCQALLAAGLACAIYWFHPFMWYALHRLRAEQEQAADDAVVMAGVAPADYVRHLVEIARLGQTEALLAGAGAHNTLAARAANILDEKRRRHVQNRRMVLASVAAIVATAIPLAALQANKKVYRISDEGIAAPALLVKQEPKYTEEARDAKIQGTVVVTAIVEVDGRLANIEIKESLDPGLDQNAIAALSNWVFKPAEKDGAPVRVSCTIQVNFRLV